MTAGRWRDRQVVNKNGRPGCRKKCRLVIWLRFVIPKYDFIYFICCAKLSAAWKTVSHNRLVPGTITQQERRRRDQSTHCVHWIWWQETNNSWGRQRIDAAPLERDTIQMLCTRRSASPMQRKFFQRPSVAFRHNAEESRLFIEWSKISKLIRDWQWWSSVSVCRQRSIMSWPHQVDLVSTHESNTLSRSPSSYL